MSYASIAALRKQCTMRSGAIATVGLLFLCGWAASKPTYQIIDGVEVVWEKPPNAHSVLFLAHGCMHKAVDWWVRSEECPLCTGMPSELHISRHARARGYAIVAISPIGGNRWGCWQDQDEENVLQPSDDMKRVLNSLHHVINAQGMEALPFYAYGPSAGSRLVMTLPFYMNVTAIGPSVGTISTKLLHKMLAAVREKNPNFKYPPAAFSHMPRDTMFATHIAAVRVMLQQLGVKTTETLIKPRSLDAKSMAQVVHIPEAHAAKILKMFRDEGYLDDNNMLMDNPWRLNYRGLLRRDPELFYIPTAQGLTPLWQYIAVSYANHEIAAEPIDFMFDWWESLRKSPQDM